MLRVVRHQRVYRSVAAFPARLVHDYTIECSTGARHLFIHFICPHSAVPIRVQSCIHNGKTFDNALIRVMAGKSHPFLPVAVAELWKFRTIFMSIASLFAFPTAMRLFVAYVRSEISWPQLYTETTALTYQWRDRP